MRQSQMFIPTLRETPTEAESLSHRLMLKSGMIKQLARGIYAYLPITQLVLNNIQDIVREEMMNIGGAEVHLPVLHPRELWEESGRWDAYGKELMRIRDRHDREFALGPTHEEVITSLVRDELKSYKKLPLTLFQIQTKFRDELRPRFGLLRGREFIMKDAYSFHIDEESLDKTYRDMYDAYSRIFTRLDLNYRAVEADGGSIGGSHTHEFMALADIGEDTIVYTDESSYAANIEKAECTPPEERSTEEMLETEKIATPDIGTVKELADFLDADLTLTTKTMVVKTEDGLKMIVIRGDQELNDVKVKAYFNTEMIDMAADEEITAELNAAPGSLGPVGSPIPVYLDYQVEAMRNYPVGANETGYHLLNVNHERDFEAAGTGDFRFINEGETVADGSGPAKFMRGIEVGQVFKLGTKYSEAMDFNVLDQNGRAKPVLMGCYGIGISRVLSAIVESHNDDKGIYWPKSVTPFDIHLITANTKDETITGTAAEIYDILSKNHRVLYDDRNERAGVKFADSELIGLPVRIVVGRGAKDGIVEVKGRLDEESTEVRITDLTSYLADNDYA
ncbi:proline--tRNA ligase [Jeotgalicoccus nanhaiensis]|uniref:Proline--tRNA ligase n=1 Tax=Jeotgalicoccus nanhaiensis TaxID=568603 RepID=A0ABR9XV29_9STAP|nr:proline--tRNA ligase [Jeotgalicoccus nanhaiensis]MBF0752673.1 proline--tRNA ligase [Jeotgalicoccus nanhaiensis]TFU62846.1 proline--tRNA ligase [Jeotgalicoccus nanhaiensis]